jgi:hypothetical protein
MVDDFLNQRKVRDKAPSVYMAEFTKQNDEIEATMKTHLINLEKDGVWDDDYRKFFEHRCETKSKELRKRIISREIDQLGQAINEDDLEEAELEE